MVGGNTVIMRCMRNLAICNLSEIPTGSPRRQLEITNCDIKMWWFSILEKVLNLGVMFGGVRGILYLCR